MDKIIIELNGTLTPVTREELFQMAADGRINPETKLVYNNIPMVCKKVKGLFSSSNTDFMKKVPAVFSNAKDGNFGNSFLENTDWNKTNLNSQNFNNFNLNNGNIQDRNTNSSNLSKQNHDGSDPDYSFSEPLIISKDDSDNNFPSGNSSNFQNLSFKNVNFQQANFQNPNLQNANFQPLNPRGPLQEKGLLQENGISYSQDSPQLSPQRRSTIFGLRNILIVIGVILSISLFTVMIFSCRSQKKSSPQMELVVDNSSGKINTPLPGNNFSSPGNVSNKGQQALGPNSSEKGFRNDSGNGQQSSKERSSDKNAMGTDPSSARNDSKSPSVPTAENQIAEEDYSLEKYEHLASPFLLTLESEKKDSVFLHLTVRDNPDEEEKTNIKKLNDSPAVKSLMVTFDKNVSDAGMTFFSDLSKLEIVYLKGKTDVSNSGLETIATFPNLKVFITSSHTKENSKWDEKGLHSFTNSKKLRSFSVRDSDFRDNDFSFLEKMTNLYKLDLSFNSDLTGDFLEHLPGLTQLRILDLSRVDSIDLTAAGVLGKLRFLTELALTSPLINDEGFEYILNLSNLKKLEIDGCSLSKKSFEKIGQLKKLEELVVGGPGFDDSCAFALKDLENLKNLKSFEIKSGTVTTAGIEIFMNFPHLKSLTLFNLYDVTDKTLNKLSQLQDLEKFFIYNSPQITDSGCRSLCKCSKLKEFSLQDCSEITGLFFQTISEWLSLTKLTFSDEERGISEENLMPLTRLTKLTSLILESENISNRFVDDLKNLKNLKNLSLRNVSCSSSAIDKLAEIKNLKYLVFLNCPNLFQNDINRFKKLMPGCVVDYYSSSDSSNKKTIEETKRENAILNIESKTSFAGIKLGEKLEDIRVRFPDAESRVYKLYDNSTALKIKLSSQKYKSAIVSFYKGHSVCILLWHRLITPSEYYDSGKSLLRKYKCLVDDARLNSDGQGEAFFEDENSLCPTNVYLTRKIKNASYNIITMYSHVGLLELQKNNTLSESKQTDTFNELEALDDPIVPVKEKKKKEKKEPFSYISKNYDRMQEITWFAPQSFEFSNDGENRTFALKLYFGKLDNGKLSLRLWTSYTDVYSDYHDHQWIFYDKVQFLGSNGIKVSVNTKYPEKDTEVKMDSLEEWADENITSQREDFFKLIQSSNVYVKFNGKYDYEYKLNYISHHVFKSVANKYMLEMNNSKGEIGK